MPPPLLPTINRLSNQLTVLTQPRHIDAISRRLKLLLSDLDRMNPPASSTGSQATRRQSGHGAEPSAGEGETVTQAPLQLQEQVLPMLNRLSPHLPQIPHILARLRTLSALHSSAASFDESLGSLEEGQRSVRSALGELGDALEKVEASMRDNDKVVGGNVESLEKRVDQLVERMKGW